MSVNTLPAKNEEYAAREYWYASDRSHLMCYQTIAASQGPKIRAVSPLLPADADSFTTSWFGREAEDATFDWFKRYEDVAHLLHQVLPDKNARVLMLGCGNSTLSEDVRLSILPCPHNPPHDCVVSQMYDDGYKNIVNVDVRAPVSISLTSLSLTTGREHGSQYSPVVIERMRARNHDRPDMTCNLLSSRFSTKTFISWVSTHSFSLGLVMDIRKLEFEDNSIDVAIDKGDHWGPDRWAFGLNYIPRYDGRNDDHQGRRLGTVFL
jgi:hypothetical protein